MMVTKKGQTLRFAIENVTSRSRTSGSVIGMKLLGDDQIIAMGAVVPNSHLLVVSKGGYGKMTATSSYPRKGLKGQGASTFRVTEKAGRGKSGSPTITWRP